MPDDMVLVKPRISVRQLDTYLDAIRRSVGSHAYRHLWADVDGQRVDIVQGGALSCAYFVSWILLHFRLISEPHAGIRGLLADMERSGWTSLEAGDRTIGAVIEWQPHLAPDGAMHGHVGFCTTPKTAISHCSLPRYPDEHPIAGRSSLSVKAIYTHAFLSLH